MSRQTPNALVRVTDSATGTWFENSQSSPWDLFLFRQRYGEKDFSSGRIWLLGSETPSHPLPRDNLSTWEKWSPNYIIWIFFTKSSGPNTNLFQSTFTDTPRNDEQPLAWPSWQKKLNITKWIGLPSKRAFLIDLCQTGVQTRWTPKATARRDFRRQA